MRISKIWLFLGPLFFFTNAQAVCEMTGFTNKAVYSLPGGGYWIQAVGNHYVSYVGKGSQKNRLYDLENRREMPATDGIDGYGLSDGDLLVNPEPMRFYRLTDVVQKGKNAQPIYTDPDHTGNYQSVAIMNREGDTRNVRVLMAAGAGAIQDYKIQKDGSNYKFAKVYAKPVPICRNLQKDDIDFEVPILSRGGTMMAATDFYTRTTKVYKIKMPGGDCEQVADLKADTDKVSFSFDDKKISFGSYWTHDGVTKKSVKIYDLDTKKITTVSLQPENVIYHGFRPDGTLMYTTEKLPTDDTDLVIVDPEAAKISDQERATATTVGRMWALQCHHDVSDDEAALLGVRMRKLECLRTIEKQKVSDEVKSFCSRPLRSSSSSVNGNQ